ncbi:hypothetical protein T492DRAFT_186620 [Pavlovales sp. CCMP2436]|nr:hypothetical protein T492DRAFT_186620 [Pavlovales sp. CCMP2436]
MELRAELAVLREAAGGHATEFRRAQYERAKRAKLEDEVVRADVSELVLTIALDEADAQAAATLRTLEQSRAGSQFGAMQRRAEAAESARDALQLECNDLTRTTGKLKMSVGGLRSANAAMKRKRALEEGEAAQHSARLKETERVAADDGSRLHLDRVHAEQLLRKAAAATAAAASAHRELEGARRGQRACDDVERIKAARRAAQAARRAKSADKAAGRPRACRCSHRPHFGAAQSVQGARAALGGARIAEAHHLRRQHGSWPRDARARLRGQVRRVRPGAARHDQQVGRLSILLRGQVRGRQPHPALGPYCRFRERAGVCGPAPTLRAGQALASAHCPHAPPPPPLLPPRRSKSTW